jgi:hypothetical protein
MIVVDNTIISEDLTDVCFSCDLKRCKGDCCVEGDAGAPLEEEEISLLEDYIDEIKPFMNEAGRETVEDVGVFEYDIDGEMVTPLVNNRECAFVVFENGIAMCAIEKAWMAGKTDFRKPVSCHLYPVRISKLKNHIAVNYHKWDICNAALIKGKKENLPLYKYLEEPLTRKFGKEWYKKLTEAVEKKQKG